MLDLLLRLRPYLIAVLILNTLIALVLVAIGIEGGLAHNLVFAHAIGLSIMLLICVPLMTIWRDQQLPAWKYFAHVVGATILGYLLGGWIGASLTGHGKVVGGLLVGNRMVLLPLVATVVASASFNVYFWMRDRMKTLTLEAETERTRAETAAHQAAEAELRLVRTQIEPHMLFNTLANVRALIGVDPPRAQQMVDQLIDFLRATLTASRQDRVTLRTEFDLLANYLELISIRMGSRLAYALDLPLELADRRILPMMLQPLVENAVKHGLEPSIEGGRIDVQARAQGQRLELRVTDSGQGFSRSPHAATGSDGFGLSQLKERLATAYGEQAGLSIESPLPGSRSGSRITLSLPEE